MKTRKNSGFILTGVLLLLIAFNGRSEIIQKQFLAWEGGFHSSKSGLPEKWHPATVPGAVQLDYAAAQKWGPFYYAERWKDYLWMEDVYWTYRTKFTKPDLTAGNKLFFVSKGIDYEFEILLNGEKIFYQEVCLLQCISI
jgi:beta-mannosidase